MSALLILFALTGLVWLLAMGRHLSVVAGSLLVVLVGVIWGHPFFNIDVGPVPLTIDRLMWLWLMLAVVVLWFLGRWQPRPLDRTDLLVAGFVVVVIVSTLTHNWRFQDNLPLARLVFFNLMPVGLYVAVRHCRIETGHLMVFYVVLALFGGWLGLTAIFEQRELHALVFPRFILDPQYPEFVGRARGPFLNPVACGIYLGICLAAMAACWPRAHPLARVFLALGMLICLTASFLTLTRSVWLSCFVCVAVMAWFPAPRPVRGALVVTGTLLIVMACLVFADRFNRFQRDKDVSAAAMAESAKLRPMLAHVALRMVRDKPLFGHGFGQYMEARKPYHFDDTAGLPLSRVLPYTQHNVFLAYLTETGMLGGGLLLLLLMILTFESWQLWKARGLPLPERQFGFLGLTVAAGYFINGMFHDVSIIPHVNSILFLTLGIADNLCITRANAAKVTAETSVPPQKRLAA
jgi:O-antigen ligase